MAKLCGSSEAAREARQKLRDTAQLLYAMTSEERNALVHLADTCRDDSFEKMNWYMDQVIRQINAGMSDIRNVCDYLNAYAELVDSIEHRYIGTAVGIGAGVGVGVAARALHQSAGCAGGSVSTAQPMTRQQWHHTDEGMVFDSPQELAPQLDIQQGKGAAQGTCGLCSCENVCKMAGTPVTEIQMYQLACDNGLCTRSGGTSPDSRESLLALMGISSHQEDQSIDAIAAAIMQGKGVILSVDANKLYGRFSFFPALHAITVTSVTVDPYGEVTGITVCDSNARYRGQNGAYTYTPEKLKKALTKRKMNVTDVIR